MFYKLWYNLDMILRRDYGEKVNVMNNLWTLLGITIAVVVFAIGFVIYLCITKPDYYIIKSLFIICLAIFFAITDIPYMKDVIEQETTTIIAEYHHFQPSNTPPGTRKLFFESQDGELWLLATTISRTVAYMEEGKTYEIEYFNNSKVIKEYKRIWDTE